MKYEPLYIPIELSDIFLKKRNKVENITELMNFTQKISMKLVLPILFNVLLFVSLVNL